MVWSPNLPKSRPHVAREAAICRQLLRGSGPNFKVTETAHGQRDLTEIRDFGQQLPNSQNQGCYVTRCSGRGLRSPKTRLVKGTSSEPRKRRVALRLLWQSLGTLARWTLKSYPQGQGKSKESS